VVDGGTEDIATLIGVGGTIGSLYNPILQGQMLKLKGLK